MELVTGINCSAGVTTVRAVGAGGTVVEFDAGELEARGLPVLGGGEAERRCLTSDLSTWRPVGLGEYAAAFGHQLSGMTDHSAWEFDHGKTRVVVPALALLRALVRHKSLFPRLFQAQSIDDVCLYVGGGREAPVELADWVGPQRERVKPTTLLPLSWFYCFPSARQAWASVYLSAKAGKLDVKLPKLACTFTVKGRLLGDSLFVTSLRTKTHDVQEPPFEFAPDHPRTFYSCAAALTGVDRVSKAGDLSSMLHPYAPLSDGEWESLRPLILGKKGKGAAGLREALEIALLKFAEGLRWPDAMRRRGSIVPRVPTAFSRWQADGRWDAAVQRLVELRAAG